MDLGDNLKSITINELEAEMMNEMMDYLKQFHSSHFKFRIQSVFTRLCRYAIKNYYDQTKFKYSTISKEKLRVLVINAFIKNLGRMFNNEKIVESFKTELKSKLNHNNLLKTNNQILIYIPEYWNKIWDI